MTPKTNRREFIRQSLLLGSGLAIGFSPGLANTLLNGSQLREFEITPFIIIPISGKIILISTTPDMGQGSTQAIPTLIAEELEVDLDQITVIPSDGSAKYGTQIAGGSGSIVRAWEPLRKAGAAAREVLIKAAAETWKVSVAHCQAEKGFVINTLTTERLSYGQLAAKAVGYTLPQAPRLKARNEFKLIGKVEKRPDVIDRVTGKARFGIDVMVPGMVYAAVLHPPSLYGTAQAFEASGAREVAGVLDVILCERVIMQSKVVGVAVIASNSWSAMQGKKKLGVTWNLVKDGVNSENYTIDMQAAAREGGPIHESSGDFDTAYSQSVSGLESLYESHFVSHAMLEPENVVAHVKRDGTAEIWILLSISGMGKGFRSKVPGNRS